MTAEQIPPRTAAAASHAPGTDVVGRRIVGLIVDVAVLGAVGYVLTQVLEAVFTDPAYGGMSPAGRILAIVLGIAFWLAAFVAVPTATGGSTLGMRLAGVRAVRAVDGGAPSAVAHLLRMICLIVDGAVSGLVGFVIILNSRNRRRLGDMVAGTLVVRS
ncbi:RDD family protein [Actinomycetospora soli]|uniref:RDD family protein n=1 Tax=Actinomycetospora soli TaxID=2893887 RepID=UPI001E2FA264|nr:RDD family protein [Actinomycetospora soli]MCD2186827.1 RDD family protein [Actinomycetospora soli]